MLNARSIAMDADFTTIEVRGVPSGFPEDRMIDKLMIHFLRPRNGGGEVLRVLYSRRTPQQAFVIFEHSDVAARVLQRPHVLQVEGECFPLTIRQGERAEVDLPVRTTLSLQKFRDQKAVLSILSRYGFQVSREHPGQLLLEGTFLRLSAARVKLAELLAAEAQSQSSSAEPRPSVRSTGAVSKWRHSPDADVSYGQNGAVVHSGRRSLEEAESSPPSASSFTSLPSPYRPYDTQSGSFADSFLSNSLPGKRHSVGHHRDRASFDVDADTLRFARSFRGDRIKEVLQAHSVEMEVEGAGGSGGEHRRRGGPRRDARQGEAGELPHGGSGGPPHPGDPAVLPEPGAAVAGVQTHPDSVSPLPGRGGLALERGRLLRRSSSLPRQPGRASARDHEPGSAGAGGYAPSKYDGELTGRVSRQGAGGTGSTPPIEPHRKRSASESRSKAKEGRAAPRHVGSGGAPSAGAQRTTEKEQPSKRNNFPHLRSQLMPLKAFKDKISSSLKR
ncbi:hypothetical protein SKAU_G00405410 [Synaphobranchus kaupii]|uniref:PAR14-like first RRM domain-containing protein n=1 Tax=Synaphobranchus kaupii TaxID=118154 RepID=A0A9Q1E9U2_SYNKA|nr:hypothetical protein SKAU_G00405410 [Synaphobranchus kaupii]